MRLLVLDLDGVVRHFDSSAQATIEQRHGLEAGALWRAAFEHPRGHAVITGGLSRAAWMAEIDAELGCAAASQWLSRPGTVDSAMTALVDRERAAGRRVVVLTNATDTIGFELERDGLAGVFDEVYASAAIGVAKPDGGAFTHVLEHEGVAANDAIFVDDSTRNVEAARALGMQAFVFESAQQVEQLLD